MSFGICILRHTHTHINTCINIYVTTVNKKDYKFERLRRDIWEDLEGRKERGNDLFTYSLKKF